MFTHRPAALGASLLMLVLVPAQRLHAQEGKRDSRKLFEHVSRQFDLSPEQQALLEKAKADVTVVKGQVNLVKVLADRLSDPGLAQLELNVSEKTAFMFDRTDSKKSAKGGTFWKGSLRLPEADTAPPLRAQFYSRGDSTTGSFWTKEGLFTVKPLGKGLHAIIKRDLTKLPKDHPPEFKRVEEDAKEKEAKKSDPLAEDPPGGHDIAVLVVYTDKAAEKHDDIDFFLESLFELTNDTYSDSEIALELVRAHDTQVEYTESEVITTDLARLMDPGDGQMDNVHQLRDDHKGDVVVLLISDADYAGYAAAILADNGEEAFAVADIDYADWYYTFAHEIGHLQGARHDPDHDPTETPYKYGHGYQHTAGNPKWRTIMAYNCEGGCTRIGQWSNPSVEHAGNPTGTEELHDNARVLRGTATTIAGHRD
jgi:hypothetical protein